MADTNFISDLATRLARAAPLLLREENDWDPFYEVVEEVLALTEPEDEMMVITSVMEYFYQEYPERAGDIIDALLHEMELESEYHVGVTQDGVERACLMFAMPFVISSEDNPNLYFRRGADLHALEDILREAQVISEVADFRLVPRVFEKHELLQRTFGEYFRMTTAWGAQLLAHEELDVNDMPFLNVPSPAARTLPQSNNPFVKTYYLVGVLNARERDMADVFPPVSMRDPSDPEDEGDTAQDEVEDQLFGELEKRANDHGGSDPGELADGSDWEEVFCEELCTALELMHAPLAALMPAGFHEDLSAGLDLEREVGLQHQFRVAMENAGLTPDDVVVEQVPLTNGEGVVQGWSVALVDIAEDEALEELSWPVLLHEDADETTYSLRMALKGLGLAFEDDEFLPVVGVSRMVH